MAKKKKKEQQISDFPAMASGVFPVSAQIIQRLLSVQNEAYDDQDSDENWIDVTNSVRRAQASPNVKRVFASESVSFCHNPNCRDGIILVVPEMESARDMMRDLGTDNLPIQVNVIHPHTQHVGHSMIDIETMKDHVNKCQEAIALAESIQTQIRNG